MDLLGPRNGGKSVRRMTFEQYPIAAFRHAATAVNNDVLCCTELPPAGLVPSEPFPPAHASWRSSDGPHRDGQPWKREEEIARKIERERERESRQERERRGRGRKTTGTFIVHQ